MEFSRGLGEDSPVGFSVWNNVCVDVVKFVNQGNTQVCWRIADWNRRGISSKPCLQRCPWSRDELTTKVYCWWAPMGDQWIRCGGGRQLRLRSVFHPWPQCTMRTITNLPANVYKLCKGLWTRPSSDWEGPWGALGSLGVPRGTQKGPELAKNKSKKSRSFFIEEQLFHDILVLVTEAQLLATVIGQNHDPSL